MNKLLVICGPTATGKTSLALSLAGLFAGQILSADSRQVYKYMDIGTGKDRPEGINIWGYDLAEPSEEFSVSQYATLAREKIQSVWNESKLPILVGGTGLYIKAVVDGIETANIPPDEKLREELIQKSAEELFAMLSSVDAKKATSLNDSDKKNPRRLIRAIEIAKATPYPQEPKLDADVLFIGLKLNQQEQEKRIKERVEARLTQGFEEEIKRLQGLGIGWHHQSMSSLGYRQWQGVLSGKMPREQGIAEWITEEKKYAKRQMTWFKKDWRILWFDATDENLLQEVEIAVAAWHNTN